MDIIAPLPKPIEEEEGMEFEPWLTNQFKDDIFKILRPPKGSEQTILQSLNVGELMNSFLGREKKKPKLRLNLAGLNRMRMRKLQVKLIQQVLHMHYYRTEPKGWEEILEQYSRLSLCVDLHGMNTHKVSVNAARDYDYIRTCVERGINDPFIVTTEKQVDTVVLISQLGNIPIEELEKDGLIEINHDTFAPPVEKEPLPIGGTRMATTQAQKNKDFITRLVFSFVGGIFLVGPMWLMVLHNTHYTALISTSVFVFVCGVLTAINLGDPISVLSTTAAYAAVLVVFVGTNTASSQSNG